MRGLIECLEHHTAHAPAKIILTQVELDEDKVAILLGNQIRMRTHCQIMVDVVKMRPRHDF